MKLGITQYAASADGTKFIEAAARLKLSAVEPYIGDINSEFLQHSPEQARKLTEDTRRCGIQIPSVCLGLFNSDPAVIEADHVEKAVRIVSDALRFTASIGGQLMLLCTYVVSNPDTAQKRENLIHVVTSVDKLARQLGVRIGLESPLAADALAKVVDRIASQNVGVYYDFGNAVSLGFDPAREIPVLGDQIFAIHVKDSVRGKLGGLHLGDGHLDLGAAMKATRSIGYDNWLLLETPGGDEAKSRADIETLCQYL